MTHEFEIYKNQIISVIEESEVGISDILPSTWTEENMVMQKPFPGPFRYDKTPYTREIIDCLAPDHPARRIAVMKGAQLGFSSGVIYPGIGWIIKNNPGNSFITVGAPDLIEKSMEKLDLMIDSCGLRPLIKPQVSRNRANKSGDTNFKKEFPNGYVTIASANNHKAIRQIDLQYGFFDDFESIKKESKESGSTRKLLEQRFASYADTCKIFYISTPEQKQISNIEPAYLLGDQRKYMIPCPCCGEFIELKWTIEENGKTGGMMWKLDDNEKLINDSVGYICQKCGGFFDDRNKQELLINGFWQPTAQPSQEGYYSYHISSLYAPLGMYDWRHYVNDYIEANPLNQPRKEAEHKAFVNLCLGDTYETSAESPKANSIQKNTRPYEVGIIPEKMSINDGNGSILLLTCAVDMNGTIEDGRLDYEIVAWSESGATYSIMHGSIGTFIPRENTLKHKVDRERWTYEENKENSVWPVLDKILSTSFKTDTDREMQVFMAGLDCGNFKSYAYSYLDRTNSLVVGLKGTKGDKYIQFGADVSIFKHSQERANLYILQVGLIKDSLSDFMNLKWTERDGDQPSNFMNFPQPSNGLYGFSNFFEHFESEHRVIETKGGTGIAARWVKKSSNSQNHLWDCRVYNIAMREIILDKLGKELKRKSFTWRDYVEIVTR